MENTDEKNNLLPDRDIFGFEKPVIVTDKIFAPEEKPDLKVTYAGLGIRFLAYFLDAALLIFPLYYIELAILGDDHNNAEVRLQQLFIDIMVWTAYYAVM